MALSESVNESLDDATSSLRNALAFAARTEKPFICKEIAGLIHQIDSVKQSEELFDMLDTLKSDKNV
jgi:hypothetical protein|tara:strand:- start:6378 stop:6578 length:201 start_codon:yes stop_codon:yes gene_type:complete